MYTDFFTLKNKIAHYIGVQRGGGDRLSPPPFLDILLRISQKQLIFLNIRPPLVSPQFFGVYLYAPVRD